MMVEMYPNLKEEVGGSIPGCEISSLLDIRLARWSTASCALTLACRLSISFFQVWFFFKKKNHILTRCFMKQGCGSVCFFVNSMCMCCGVL